MIKLTYLTPGTSDLHQHVSILPPQKMALTLLCFF